MILDKLSTGKDVPNDFNVVIEISAHSDPVKYEIDKDSGAVVVDRFMSTAMHYPCNYGFIPNTLSEDGDPVDVLVVAPFQLPPGVVVRCRTLGMLAMEDEAGEDAKLIAVPVPKLTSMYDGVESVDDLPEKLTKQIAHFFEHYKDLEPGKWVKVRGWEGADAARNEIVAGIKRAKEQK